MEEKKHGVFSQLKKDVRKRLITGLLLILPVYVTFFVVKFLFGFVGGTLAPVIKKLLQFLGVALPKTTIVKSIYSSVKQIIHAVSLPGKQSFKRVVLVDFPREGTKSIGFVTGDINYNNKEKLICVFIPTTPNPTT